jgi:Na+(H+)/acetate symporter ActP
VANISYSNVINIVYLVFSNLIPFVLIMLMTAFMIKGLYESRRNLETIINKKMKNRKIKDIKFAINSIVLNILFICLKIPFTCIYIKSSQPFVTDTIYALVTFFLFYVNFSISFFAHLASNSIFRNEVIVMAKFWKKNQTVSGTTNINTVTGRTAPQ